MQHEIFRECNLEVNELVNLVKQSAVGHNHLYKGTI